MNKKITYYSKKILTLLLSICLLSSFFTLTSCGEDDSPVIEENSGDEDEDDIDEDDNGDNEEETDDDESDDGTNDEETDEDEETDDEEGDSEDDETGDGSLNPDAAPSVNFDLSTWKINIPIDENNDDKSDDISVTNLNNGFEDSRFFYTAEDGGMVFKCPVEGYKTSENTSYTRSELREMLRKENTCLLYTSPSPRDA